MDARKTPQKRFCAVTDGIQAERKDEMAYLKQNFKSGQVLTAAQMNHIESGIENNDAEIAKLKMQSGNSDGSVTSVNGKTGAVTLNASDVGAASVDHTHSQYLTEVPAGYVTETELNEKGYLTQHQDLSGYAKQTEVNQLKSELDEKVNKSSATLGIHTDGLIYLFVDGQPNGGGIALPEGGTSGDVIGYVDSENTIVLTGYLAENDYTVKYEMEDGTLLEVGTLALGAEESEYQNVEWIQINNSGTYHCGIKTDLSWSGVNKIVAKVQNIHSGEAKDIIFSTWTSATAKAAPFIRTYSGGNLFANASGLTGYAITPTVDNADTNANEFTMTWSSANTDGTIFFGSYQDDSYSNPHKWYSVKFYNGNTLVGDFVPCYRNSDGVIGFHDEISGNFYTNTSTETNFIKGDNV